VPEASDTIRKAARPRKPGVGRTPSATIAAPASVTPAVPALTEIVAETLPVTPAQIAETLEAVTSPAVPRDVISGVAEAAAPISKGISDMATVTSSPSEAADKAQAMFGDVTGRFKTAFEKSSKMSEDMVDFAKGNVEAVIASAKVAAKASESLGQEAAEYGKKNLETATAAFKSFATVKSPTELFQLQSEFAKASFDGMVAEASKFSESMMKLAGDIAQPLSTRYALAAEKFKAPTL